MDRYDTRIDADDTLYVESGEGELEVGDMSDVCEILGGDTYTLEYDEKARATGWLRTDEDGTISFDVRETIDEMDFDERFVRKLADAAIDRETPEGYPERTARFAELMREIWDSKGAVDIDDL